MRSFAFRPGLSHALHQVRKQGCPSSPALSSTRGVSRQEIADIPHFAAPPGDAHRARGSLIFAPLQHAGCNTSANLSCSGSRSLCRLQSQPLRDLGAEADVEVGFARSTSDAGCRRACARQRRSRTACSTVWRSAGPRHAMRPLPDAQQKARSRLAKRFPDADVALFGNAPLIVDRCARLMSPGRQAEMRANGSRSGKAQRVINPDLERKRCNRSDTGNGHQAAADGIVLNHLQKHPMQFGRIRQGSPGARPASSRSSSKRRYPCARSARARALHIGRG